MRNGALDLARLHAEELFCVLELLPSDFILPLLHRHFVHLGGALQREAVGCALRSSAKQCEAVRAVRAALSLFCSAACCISCMACCILCRSFRVRTRRSRVRKRVSGACTIGSMRERARLRLQFKKGRLARVCVQARRGCGKSQRCRRRHFISGHAPVYASRRATRCRRSFGPS